MLLIACPWCGPRDEIEFSCGGQASIERPGPPGSVSDAAWADYLFFRDNPNGVHVERWRHAYGCGRWFTLHRSTATHEIVSATGTGGAA
jgi:heterotetrameric sarcosine oxidase delta subunit